MRNRFIYYLLSCFLITLFSGLVYVSIQRSLRLSANDTQVQITQDILISLSQGADPKQLSSTTVDISTTLSPFVIIFDNKEKVVGSTAELDGKTPVPPKGVFESVRKNKENRFTWEPKKGIRHAAVMVKYKDGFILAGKNLREVENRIKIILMLSAVTWVIAISATSLAFLITRPKPVDKRSKLSPPKRSTGKSKK